MSTPLDHPSTPPPSPPTRTLPPSYPTSPTDPINPPGLLRFRPARLRTPATSPMRAGAAAYARAAWRRLMVGEEEAETLEPESPEDFEIMFGSVSIEGRDDIGVGAEEAALDFELNHPSIPGEHTSNPSTSPAPPSNLLRGRRYTVALIDEGSRVSAWRPPRSRTPVPSPVREFEAGSGSEGEEGDGRVGNGEAEIGIEVESASEDEGDDEGESDDGGECEGDSGTEGTFGLSSVREFVPLLRTLNAENPFGAGAVPQLVDVVWPAGSSAEESSGDEEGASGGEASGDEEESREEEIRLERIAEDEEPVNWADDGESIRMVSHGESNDPHSEVRGDGEGKGASGQEDSHFQGEPLEGEGQVALVGSHTYFLHLPLADRPRRGRGPRGGAQIQRLGWWVSL